MKKNNEYNLFTAISLIVGIVIGSGIFFRSDDVLGYTSGSVVQGILVFIIAGISIVFGSLTISKIAMMTNKAGGIITYMEETLNAHAAGSIGWFHSFVYYPTLVVVVSWVAGIYLCMLFNLPGELMVQCAIGFFFVVLFFTLNVLAKKIGGYFQVGTTVIKLIPLVLIAVLGVVYGDTTNITIEPIIKTTSNIGFIAAIVPIAFSFDGWIVASSMSHEIKNAKKNLPLALTISPFFIVMIYSLYLVGISAILGPEQVIALGDSHVYVASEFLFGALGAKIILIFVIISVLGTVNGLIIGIIRLPYGLALRNMIPNSNRIKEVNQNLDIPVNSAILSFVITCIWFIIHYFVMKYQLLGGSDVSEISIVMNYVCYIGIYLGVIRLYQKKKVKGMISSVFNPIIATIGSLIIFFGSLIVVSQEGLVFNVKAFVFMLLSSIILTIAYLYCKKHAICSEK